MTAMGTNLPLAILVTMACFQPTADIRCKIAPVTEGYGMQRRKLVDNKWVTFLEDKFSLSNGSECTYYHAQKSDAVMAIVVEGNTSNGYTYIVNQHRHPIEQTLWQFPIGGFDSETEDLIESAKKRY